MASKEIEALGFVNLNWVVALESVWSEPTADVEEIQGHIRSEFAARLRMLCASDDPASPLGWVITGHAGTGKTHLLGRFRAECARQHASFVLVDMTDVRDFWDTVLLGYITSLQQQLDGNTSQFEQLIFALIGQFKIKKPPAEIFAAIRTATGDKLIQDLNTVASGVSRRFPREGLAHADVVRAVLALKSEDQGVAGIAYTWLTGEEIDQDDRRRLGLSKPREKSSAIVRGLSWLMSLRGPSVVALDQLDPIVTQLKFAGDAMDSDVSLAIINKIGAGFSELRDATRRTLVVLSCVEQTWNAMLGHTLKGFTDRFEPTRVLAPTKLAQTAESLIARRLKPAFDRAKFTPPYPSWPFKPEWIGKLRIDSPREILRSCYEHVMECVRRGEVKELPPGWKEPTDDVKPDGFADLDARFKQLRGAANPKALISEANEDGRFAALIRSAARCALREVKLPDSVDSLVDVDFAGAPASKPLHARMRLVFTNENGREEHVCLRALQKANANAFTARLRSAITYAGIDRAMKFRRLVMLRSGALPGGTVTRKLIQEFDKQGGVWLKPSEEDLATLDALEQMEKLNEPKFADWLRDRQPASKTQLVKVALTPLFNLTVAKNASVETPAKTVEATNGGLKTEAVSTRPTAPPPAVSPQEKNVPSTSNSSTTLPPSPASNGLLLGYRLIADRPASQPTLLPPSALQKHGVVFAGAGSGKTVLLKRLVEETALAGIPSIVIDAANDLAAIGDPWPAPPEQWGPGDAALAQRFLLTTERIIWTPGKESGNPLTLEPLPDLTSLLASPEELDEAIQMAVASLMPVVGTGAAAMANKKKAILTNALRFLAQQGDCHLDGLAAMLRDFPDEATTKIANEQKLAMAMADDLSAQLTNDPMLKSSGTPMDPAKLLTGTNGKTRISIISLVGLSSVEQQQQFLNQLAMILFTWIKKNPKPPGLALRGLLVIDEARDFVPSNRNTACLQSMQRLAAQARKYGLGLILATQNPKDIDNKIAAQCSTQWYGKMSSPVAIETAAELLRARGSNSGEDVGSLKTGRFYVSNSDHLSPPAKLLTPMCLSAHLGPMTPEAVLEKAAASRSPVE